MRWGEAGLATSALLLGESDRSMQIDTFSYFAMRDTALCILATSSCLLNLLLPASIVAMGLLRTPKPSLQDLAILGCLDAI